MKKSHNIPLNEHSILWARPPSFAGNVFYIFQHVEHSLGLRNQELMKSTIIYLPILLITASS